MTDLHHSIPPGWESRVDPTSGKQYFINHYTKSTTWEDPRTKHRYHGTPLHISTGVSEYIPLQHGSPELKRNTIYPSQHSPIPAFQIPGHPSPKYIPLQEMRSSSNTSPLSVRTARIQDSSFITIPDTTDDMVTKIGSLFPTVSDTHIRLLLKKYHNREAVVISALQVEKHPIVTPGPFATPPPIRNTTIPFQMTPPLGMRAFSRTSSPTYRTTSGTNSVYTGSPKVGENYRNSPRPHSSPKLKLRYMKSIYPQAEETIILDVLANNDNNILKASEKLNEMGFKKKDVVKIKQQEYEKKLQEIKAKEELLAKSNTPPPPVPLKTLAEKKKLTKDLQSSYMNLPEHVMTMALESVNFDKDRAVQILEIMLQEDNKIKGVIEEPKIDFDVNDGVQTDNLTLPTVPSSQSRQSLKSVLKEKPDNPKMTFSRVVEENSMIHKSKNLSSTNGSNPKYSRGPNEKLLLEDYVKWQGPNAGLLIGNDQVLPNGPNKSLLLKKSYKPCGANPELRKGPVFGLAKGSIFSHLKHVVMKESRGQ